MQLVSNDRRTEDSSETEPILHQSNIVQRSEESSSSSSFEIRTVSRDCSLSADDSQTIDVDEHCNLVTTDQPQCRICLDIGGLYYPSTSYSFLFISKYMLVMHLI